jgi:hypothetical protein
MLSLRTGLRLRCSTKLRDPIEVLQSQLASIPIHLGTQRTNAISLSL